ncbi:ParB N-terminal domain-containing protein [Brevibacillus brevis]|uniref:ParB N-terminal domain-containing protein n=1 Tax=Brevibacillus brevis TaxID=1393 RepID=UPI0037CCA982
MQPGDIEYEKLKRSFQEFGYVEPLIWIEQTGNLVGGHQRFKILVEQGTTEIEVSVVSLDEIREKAHNSH